MKTVCFYVVGTYKVKTGSTIWGVTEAALSCGYRLIGSVISFSTVYIVFLNYYIHLLQVVVALL